MAGKTQKSHRSRSGLYGGCSNGVPLSTFSNLPREFSSLRFLGFCKHEKGAPRQEILK
jgi:hypothetical protein